MKSFKGTLLLFFMVTLLINDASTFRVGLESQAELQAQARLNEALAKYYNIMLNLKESFWHSSGYNRVLSRQYHQHDVMDRFRNFSTNLAEYLKSLPSENFLSSSLKRQIKRLSDLQIIGLDGEHYWHAKYLLDSFTNFSTSRDICSYRDPARCDLAYLPHVSDIILRSRSPEELSYYWKEWRTRFGRKARLSFRTFVVLYRRAAFLNGHVAPSMTWYLHYDDEYFFDELTEVMNNLMPLYKELHAYVRLVLQKKVGIKYVSSYGLIPQHLMEQVIQHAWVYQSVIDPPYTHKHLPNVGQKMNEQHYTPLKLVQMAEGFFASLGFDRLSAEFWTSNSRMKARRDTEPDCKAKIFNFSPVVTYEYCPQVDFRKLLQVQGDMARIYYANLTNHLPLGLNQEAMPGFGFAIGEACILSASTSKHLKRINLLPDEVHDPEMDLKRLFRFGIHTLLSIPMYYVHEKFWTDALDNRLQSDEYNCGYWDIQREYAGVGPANLRDESTLDPNYKFFIGLNSERSHTIKFISEVLGYQFYKALCSASGEYVRGDPHRTLQNCDFYGSLKAGALLKQMMSVGASHSWRDVIHILTGERKLSASGLLEFYAPLYQWLQEQNRLNGVQVGWDKSEEVCRR